MFRKASVMAGASVFLTHTLFILHLFPQTTSLLLTMKIFFSITLTLKSAKGGTRAPSLPLASKALSALSVLVPWA